MARAFMTIGAIRNGAVTIRARGFLGPAPDAASTCSAETRGGERPATGRRTTFRRQTFHPPAGRGTIEE